MFQRRSSAPKTALRATIRMSASSAFSSPAATAQPLTAAITGLKTSTRPRVAAVAGGVVDVGAELVPLRARPVGGVLEVPAGAEGVAGAGDHEHERLVVVAEAPPGMVELLVHPPRDRVALLRAVVGEHGDVVVDLVGDLLVLHRLRLPPKIGRVSGKRYHVTTFGCQMNEHDSERMKGMLESLGYAEAPERDERRPDPLQHLLDPRGRRQPLHRPPRRGEAAEVRGPRARRRRRRLLGAVGQGRGLRALPVRRRRLRARARSGGWPSSSPPTRSPPRATSSSRTSPATCR